MKLELESTPNLASINGFDVRVWKGKTGKGIPVIAFIAVLAVEQDKDRSELDRELIEQKVELRIA